MKTVLVSALLLLPAAALAGSNFDGTWKTRLNSMKVTGKPDTFALQDGMYTCSSCVPEIKVKADGTDQKVSGHPYYDTIAVKVVSPTSIEVTEKKNGKLLNRSVYTLAADGKSFSGTFHDHSGAQEATGTFTEKRVAAAPAGAHAISGSWQPDQLGEGNDALRTVRYRMTDEQMSMQWNGQSYEAKFDGQEYPVKNDPGGTKVSLKRVDANTVEETDHRDGKVTDKIHMAAAADGKTIEVTDKDMLHDQVTTYTLEKQP
ncbi:MAG: hypothetical protein JO341_02270 [Gammaproteobacteria bacterium]|nr:hypothetical protein [Gammaproteobacteria bacterium]MBV9619824.1 hypothetical protein [Gammaproteobacteria bacterium]